MATRQVSGRVAVAILIVMAVGSVGFGVNAVVHRTDQPTPTAISQIPATITTAALVTPTVLALTIASGATPIPAASPGNAANVATASVMPATVMSLAFDPERLYAAVSPAVVTISNRQKINPNATTAREANAGSGIVYDLRGDIITNRHVIDGAETIEVTLPGGKIVAGTLVGQDPVADIAVVRIDPTDVSAVATFGDSSRVRSGERVVVIGSPLQFETSITRGIISGTDRSIGGMDGMVQTDAAISPGNSGGPLVNARGEVIGIATSTIRTNQAERIGFAIPSNYAKRLADILVADGKVTRPYIGVTTELLTLARGEELNVKAGRGAYISDISPDTPAAKAGLRKGDVIVAINGATIDAAHPLGFALLDFKPGDTVSVTINRDGAEQNSPVSLTERPASLDP